MLATVSISWSQRYDTKRTYETFGLAKGSTVLEMFIYGVLCIVGIVIVNTLTGSNDNSKKSSFATFLMMALGVMAFIFFLPLLSWFEFIFANVMYLGVALGVITLIGYFIYNIFKSNT